MDTLGKFGESYLVDTEYGAPDGGLQEIRCLVALEYRTGRVIKLWVDELGPVPPFDVGPNSLFVAYNAIAEMRCFNQLGWKHPARILDLYVEFTRVINGEPKPAKGKPVRSLLRALSWYDLPAMDIGEKKSMQQLALRGGEYTAAEKKSLLDYCEQDVLALSKLLPAMLPELDTIERACFRGRYMAALSKVEDEGVPIDAELLSRIVTNKEKIRSSLVEAKPQFNVFDGTEFSFKKFDAYLVEHDIPWPRTEKGRLFTDQKTFERNCEMYEDLRELKELKKSLSQLKNNKLMIGPDGRNRASLFPFSSKTARNQPSNSEAIFGLASWMRHLIQAPPGWAIASTDFCQEEVGIAAALSEDPNMIKSYRSGDVYLHFAFLAGAVARDVTEMGRREVEDYKSEQNAVRELFKETILGLQYNMGALSLSNRLSAAKGESVSVYTAEKFLNLHREVYAKFWEWSRDVVNGALLDNYIETVFGWRYNLVDGLKPNDRSLSNYHMQTHGSDILRLSVCLAVERGVRICVPVHDQLLICAAEGEINDSLAIMRACMAAASRIVLDGFELNTDQKIFRYPDHYVPNKKGAKEFWGIVTAVLEGLE